MQNKLVPAIPGVEGSVKSWIAVLDKLAPLHPRYVVPDHGELGDASLIAKQRGSLADVETRVKALKSQGVPVDEAGKRIRQEFQTKYADWPNLDRVVNLVKNAYAEQ